MLEEKERFHFSVVHTSEENQRKEKKEKEGDSTIPDMTQNVQGFDTLIPFHQSNRFLSSFETCVGCAYACLTTVKFKVTKW